MASPRQRAHARPANPVWHPQRFDEVFLPPRSPYLATARAMVETVFVEHRVARVTYVFVGHTQHRDLSFDELRPTGRVFEWRRSFWSGRLRFLPVKPPRAPAIPTVVRLES